MNNRGLSDFEKYILVSEHSKYALGTYPNFLKLKELRKTPFFVVKHIASKKKIVFL